MKTKKKVDVAAKLAARPKKYNLMVGYDEILETEIQAILKENKIKTQITTACYFYIKGLTKEEAERIGNLVKDVKFEFTSPKTNKSKVYKLRYISILLAPDLALGKIKRMHKKKTSGTIHSAGTKTTTYQKKIKSRAKKATLAILKAEKNKNNLKKAVSKKNELHKTVKPVQQKINFKKAAQPWERKL